MARGLLPISANFERRIAAPLDDMRVALKSDLLLPASWTADDNVVYTWLGMFALVYGDTTNNGGYLLIASDYTIESSWLQIGSSVDLSDYVTAESLFRDGLIKSELLPDISSDVIELLEIASILDDVVGMVAGEKAFYTDDNKIYTYSGTAWEDPQSPTVNKLYLCKFDNLTYKWNGTTLVATTSPLPYATNGQAIAGTSFSRVLSPYANKYAFTTWIAPYALQSWVTDNFALKESGVVPPVSEDILLTTETPSYTVVAETADNINISSTAAAGTIVLNVLAADKALKISIKTGSNAVTIAGTAYNAGVVVFAVFTESTGTWSVDSTLDPVIPDYSDVKVQKRTTTAPQQMQFSYVISGFAAGGGGKGHLIFVDIPGSALSGVYSSLITFAGTSTIAQKVIEGTSLNIVRVGAGAVYHSEYDGANLASLKFNLTVSSEEKSNWNSKQDGTTNNITPTAGGGTYTILNNRINNLRSVWLLAGTHNFNLATVTDNNIINEQYIIFRTGGTIPTINFVQPYYNGIGTVAITNGSTSVTVSGVNANMVFKAGQTFIANGVTYTVASVTNSTTIVLSVAASADFTGAYTYRPMLNYVYFPTVAVNQLWHISFLYSNNGNAWVCDISVRVI